MSARTHAWTGWWLYPAAAASLFLGLICSQSLHFRGFWPDFCIVLSLGLVLAALMHSVAAHTPERR